MTRAIERQLARIEQALGLSDGAGGVDLADHANEEWVPPEAAAQSQILLLSLFADRDRGSDWFAVRRAEVERLFPLAGYWRKRPSLEEERHTRRLCDDLLAKFRSSSRTIQALEADPAWRERVATRCRAQLRACLPETDPLQPFLAEMAAADLPMSEEGEDPALRQLRSAVEIDLGPAEYGLADPGEPLPFAQAIDPRNDPFDR